ncbi:MAG: hypothetical protein OER43_18245 [Gammaproteobacteria bacterium]|nr:hypothetical protein [Gammaproteobacteria bacterium]
MAKFALFVVGASGVGKTAALGQLETDADFRGVCRYFDSIGVPPLEDMIRLYGSGEQWQAGATDDWVRKILREPAPIVILEGQTRPSFIRGAAEAHGLTHYRIVLLDCHAEVRRERLTRGRDQPELASLDMNSWAAYLRGQADALRLPIIDTSHLSLAEVASRVREQALEVDPKCFLTGVSS